MRFLREYQYFSQEFSGIGREKGMELKGWGIGF